MSTLAKYVKAASERKRYQIDYTNWLDSGEFVLSVTFQVMNNTASHPLVVDGIAVLPTGFGAQYYVSGGNDGATYDIYASLTTTVGPQVRLDEIIFQVREP